MTTTVNNNLTFKAQTFLGIEKQFTINTTKGADARSSSGKKAHWKWEDLMELDSRPISNVSKLQKLTMEFMNSPEWIVMTYYLTAEGEDKKDLYPMEVYYNLITRDTNTIIYHPDRY